jgi:hypothetical protein
VTLPLSGAQASFLSVVMLTSTTDHGTLALPASSL